LVACCISRDLAWNVSLEVNQNSFKTTVSRDSSLYSVLVLKVVADRYDS
jgi:hypothetical protein